MLQSQNTDNKMDATSSATMINDADEFVENANIGNELNNEDGAKDTSSHSHPPHDKWIWLHAAFHCLVTMVVSRLCSTLRLSG